MAEIQRGTYFALILIKTVGKRSDEQCEAKRDESLFVHVSSSILTACLVASLFSLVLWQLDQKPAINCFL